MLRDHQPIVVEEFNGFWKRGDDESCPADHFPDCQNIQYQESGFSTRDGLDTYSAYPRVLRIYTYLYGTDPVAQESLLILDDQGNIYHDKSPTPFTPILTIAGMTDFGFQNWAGYAYINPCQGVHGLADQYVYVYRGKGLPARLAAGAGPTTGPLGLGLGAAGHVEFGHHVFAVAYETDTGFITAMKCFAEIYADGVSKIDISNIPVSPDPFVVARRIVATYAVSDVQFTHDLENGYQFFFLPDGRIDNNTDTTLSVDFFDSELLEDASYLFNLFDKIPAGVGFTVYHNRLVSYAEQKNQGLARVSVTGQPEAFDQISGLLIPPIDATALSNASEFRDILYLFKPTRTFSYSDTGGEPAGWPLSIIDEGVGCSVHGLSTVLDSGGVNIEFLVIIDFSGVMIFDGTFRRPELSWKIKDYWFTLTRTNFLNIQIMNDSIDQMLYITLPNQQMLIGDYTNGMDYMKIKWAKWKFNIEATTITLIEFNKLIIGSRQLATP
jgi:hypothetical protein